MKTLLTIFTPTFNRSHLLNRLYDSLCKQTSSNFIWLIIDDGSSDNTKELVDTWVHEKKIKIEYAYKENGGMHTAHNLAYELINTELNTCIDSDDYMPENAVELIQDFWQKNGSNHYSGLVGLDIDTHEKLIGTQLKEKSTTLMKFYHEGGRGDKKLVYRTSIMKELPPYPVFPNEKFVGLGYKYFLADLKYELLTLNKPLVIVDYQPDGSSNTILRQKKLNPRGFAFIHSIDLQYSPYLKRRIRSSISLTAELLLQNKINVFQESPNKLITLLTLPFGVCLWVYITLKNSSTNFA